MSQQAVRILIIRFSSIGDIILTAPAVAALHDAIDGDCELHFVTKKRYAPVVEGMGALIHRVHTIERSTREVVTELAELEFDYIVDFHNNLRSKRIKNTLKTLSFTVDKRNRLKWQLIKGWRKEAIPHIVTRYTETVAAFGSDSKPKWPMLWSSQSSVRKGLCIAIGATYDGKRMPSDHLDHVIQSFPDQSITLIGGPTEVSEAQRIMDNYSEVTNSVNRLSLAESVQIIRNSQVVLSGDTGMMHIAAAVGTPTITVWGCTRPALGMSAWMSAKGSRNILPEGRGQRPCSKLGNRCRYGGHRSGDFCTHHISNERVIDALQEVLT
jgi:ADP-heptose:LPS heptosyltransferase